MLFIILLLLIKNHTIEINQDASPKITNNNSSRFEQNKPKAFKKLIITVKSEDQTHV